MAHSPALVRLRAHVVVGRTCFAVDCAHIDIVAALHWMSVLPDKAISSYALCRAAGVAELLPIVVCDERAALVEAHAIEQLFVEHSLLTVALEISRDTGVALVRMLSAPRATLIESMLLTQAVARKFVPLVKRVARPPAESDGTRGGLCLSAVCGVHSHARSHWSTLRPATRRCLSSSVCAGTTGLFCCRRSCRGCCVRAAMQADRQAAGQLSRRLPVGVERRAHRAVWHHRRVVRCGAADGDAAVARLVERACTEHLKLREEERFDQVAIFNKKDMLGLLDGQVRRCTGLHDWTQCDWLRRRVPLAIKSVLLTAAAIAAAVDCRTVARGVRANLCAPDVSTSHNP